MYYFISIFSEMESKKVLKNNAQCEVSVKRWCDLLCFLIVSSQLSYYYVLIRFQISLLLLRRNCEDTSNRIITLRSHNVIISWPNQSKILNGLNQQSHSLLIVPEYLEILYRLQILVDSIGDYAQKCTSLIKM